MSAPVQAQIKLGLQLERPSQALHHTQAQQCSTMPKPKGTHPSNKGYKEHVGRCFALVRRGQLQRREQSRRAAVQWGPPAMGMPSRPASKTPTTDQRRSSQVAALSPVQCAACPPDPTNVDLHARNTATRKLSRLLLSG